MLAKRKKRRDSGTRSKVRKGPARDEKHLAIIRKAGCLACIAERGSFGLPNEAHHVRCLTPRSMGKRVSDYLAVPLCQEHHALLHTMNEGKFWQSLGDPHIEFLSWISPESKAVIEALQPRREG